MASRRQVVRSPTLRESATERPETLRKAVDALAIVPTKQRIYPLARKLYNVLLFIAQKQGLEHDIYRASLADIVSKARFNSKDIELVKNHLRQMNATQVEWQSPAQAEGSRWEVSNLIAHASIIEGGRGRAVIVEWSFAPNIKRELLDPQRFAQISLFFQSTLRTYASIALFEICSRYLNNPSGLTSRNPWAWWRPVLTGIPDNELEAYREYKYFKRDVLNPTIAEINKVTDVEIELVEHRSGRRIEDLQFRIQRKSQSTLSLSRQPDFDLTLVSDAVRLGVAQLTAENLLSRYGDDVMREALRIVGERMRAPIGEPIDSLDKYLTGVVRRLATQPSAVPPSTSVAQRRSGPTREQLEMQFRESRRREARAVFDDYSAEQRSDLLAEFERDVISAAPPVIRRSYAKGGLQSGPIRAEFSQWYASKLWGPDWATPTAEELLAALTG